MEADGGSRQDADAGAVDAVAMDDSAGAGALRYRETSQMWVGWRWR